MAKFGFAKFSYNPNLPITEYKDHILQELATTQVLVIRGTTGCGKTTQVPQFIFDEQVEKGQPCNIVITQPRKIAAQSIAHRVSDERKWIVGTVVGYQVGMENKTREDTRITYVTTGVLLQKLINFQQMTMYTHLIIDEVHERDQDMDLLLLIVKKLLNTNSRFVKVILMTATNTAYIMANYFSSQRRPAPLIEISGRTLEVKEYYFEDLIALGFTTPTLDPHKAEIPEESYDIVVKLIQSFDKIEMEEQHTPCTKEYASEHGAVLIFLPGLEEIRKLMTKLQKASRFFKYTVYPLHSSITLDEQSRVFYPTSYGFRKVILSTNIAESSITVTDVKYVIDFCLTKNVVCDPTTNYVCLQLEYASKSQCTQRKGRAGRVSNGKVYRLVEEEFYNHLSEHGVPEMKRCPLTRTVLHVKKLKCGTPQSLLAHAIDPPHRADIDNAIIALKEVGALGLNNCDSNFPSTSDGDLTFAGEVMASLPLDVHLSKLILLGFVFGCLDECIVIAASLSLQTFLSNPFHERLNSYKSILAWAELSFSDCIVLLNAYISWRTKRKRGDFLRPGAMSEEMWAKSSFLQLRRLREVDKLVTELKSRLEQFDIIVEYHKQAKKDINQLLLLKIVIAGAFYPNYFEQSEIDEVAAFRLVNNGNPYTSVVMRGLPNTHGILYFSALRDILQPCSRHISADFEDGRAYIQFNSKPRLSHECNPYPIPVSVFYAVKMRKLRLIPDLLSFSPNDAEKNMTQLKLLHEQKLASDNQNETFDSKLLASNRINVQTVETEAKNTKLPLLNETTVQLYITNVVDPGHFWARYAKQSTTWQLHFMGLIYKKDHLLPLNVEITPGMLVLAPFDKGSRYCRATVEDITGEEVQVFYVDYGKTMMVKQQDLYSIDSVPGDGYLPPLAFECQLSELKPSAVASPSGTWTTEAISYFHQRVNETTLTAKVYSIVQNVVRVELIADGTSINQELIEMNLAEHAEESYLSQQEHKRRLVCTEEVQSSDTAQSTNFSLKDVHNACKMQKTKQKIHIYGPCSPLEVSYKGLTRIDKMKSINIDRDSVNSVSLSSEIQSKKGQFLVAAGVSINQHGYAVNARHTTLMPKILGLQSLICMTFAPVVELKTDEECTEYVGCLCGLGYERDVRDAVYSDHDMDVTFDCTVTNSDILDLNVARLGINLFLGSNYNSTLREDFHEVQNAVIESIMKFVRRKREPKAIVQEHPSYTWEQIPSVSTQNREDAEGFPAYLLLEIETVKLGPSLLVKQLRQYRLELYHKADVSQEPEDIKCNFCNVVLKSRRKLLFHLQTPEHLKNESILK